jgi:hypothetical protein
MGIDRPFELVRNNFSSIEVVGIEDVRLVMDFYNLAVNLFVLARDLPESCRLGWLPDEKFSNHIEYWILSVYFAFRRVSGYISEFSFVPGYAGVIGVCVVLVGRVWWDPH